MKNIQTQAAKTLLKTRGCGSQADTNPPGEQKPRVGCGLRNAPAVPGAGATPPRHTQSRRGTAYLASARRRGAGSPGAETRYRGAAGASCLQSAQRRALKGVEMSKSEEMYRIAARVAVRGGSAAGSPPPPGSHASDNLGTPQPAASSSKVNDQAGARFLVCSAVSASVPSPFPFFFFFYFVSLPLIFHKQTMQE